VLEVHNPEYVNSITINGNRVMMESCSFSNFTVRCT